jgi:hypothetical protein
MFCSNEKVLNAHGIANTLWPHNAIGTREHLKPFHLSRTFDEIGKASMHGEKEQI